MNHWTNLSIEFANQKNYLDELFKVYPSIPNCIRNINNGVWEKIEQSFNQHNNIELVNSLLKCDLFPIKDSYIAYLKRDKSAIERNPQTVNRIAGNLYEMGFDKIFERCCEPKETNRQIGPLFKRWVRTGVLGMMPVSVKTFMSSSENAILDASDSEMLRWAKETVGYKREKGLDFAARFNGKYVIGEAKFLTDFGGHQNAQFEDAMLTLNAEVNNAVKIAILDGVVYINGNNKMHKALLQESENNIILSALMLREFLYSI